MGLTKGCYAPVSCHFLEENLVLAPGTVAQNESSPNPLLQDPAAQSVRRKNKALLGVDLVKLLSPTVPQATQLTYGPITFSLIHGNSAHDLFHRESGQISDF